MRKSVSVAFFSLMSTLLIFGTVIMGGSELVLFSNYFAQERYDVLDEVVNVAQRTASHLVQEAALPEGEELEALNTKLELIGESAEVYLFFTDCDGNVCWLQTRTIWPGMWWRRPCWKSRPRPRRIITSSVRWTAY